jgi:hypothetical protein
VEGQEGNEALMAGPIYPYRDRRFDHLYPWREDGTGPGLLMEAHLHRAEEKALSGLRDALFFPGGREAYAEKLNRLIASFDDPA